MEIYSPLTHCSNFVQLVPVVPFLDVPLKVLTVKNMNSSG